MKVGGVIGNVTRGALVYVVTAYGAAGHHHHASGLLDPVGLAAADTEGLNAQTDSFEGTCDQRFVRDGRTYYFAQHVFDRPRTASDLAGTRVLARVADDQGVPGYKYELVTKGIFVRDGAIAVECGDETSGLVFNRVVFVTSRRYKLDIDPTNPW